MRAPTVSILIPTYNYARFLPEAIESILNQDFQDFELLISDDCSADDAAAAAAPYCRRDSRVQFWRNPSNLGMVNNWNLCLQRARGKYIKYIFGDDKLAHPQALSKLIAQLENNPGAILAASARAIIDERSQVNDVWDGLSTGCHNGRQAIVRCIVENRNLVGEPSAVLFRKADAGEGFNPAYHQVPDLAFWFQLLERGDLAYIRQPLCAFRRHPLQQSAVNHHNGMARPEHMALMAQYFTKPWVSRWVAFTIVYAMRRSRRRDGTIMSSDLLEYERVVATRLNPIWYLACLMRYKITRPFINFKNSIQKRFARQQARSGDLPSVPADADLLATHPTDLPSDPQLTESIAPAVSHKSSKSVAAPDAANVLSA